MFTIQNCLAIGCEKAVVAHEITLAGVNIKSHKCAAYNAPAKLLWHRQDKACPLGPQQIVVSITQKINPLKASKRASR
jgi:hypothetical protein